MSELERINFRNDVLLAAQDETVALKPMCDAIGLNYPGQYKKLKAKSWATVGFRPTVAEDGKTRDMVVIDRRTMLMWLGGIDETRVAEHARANVIAYQSEVADALEAYWTEGGAINPRATQSQAQTLEEQARIMGLFKGIVDDNWLAAKARHVMARALGEEPEIDPATKPLDVGSYLESQGVTAKEQRSICGKFGKAVKAAYEEAHGGVPKKVDRFVDGAIRSVNGYCERDRTLFDRAWSSFVR